MFHTMGRMCISIQLMNQLVATREALDYNTRFFFYTILLSEWNMLKKAKAEHSQELHNVQQGHAPRLTKHPKRMTLL